MSGTRGDAAVIASCRQRAARRTTQRCCAPCGAPPLAPRLALSVPSRNKGSASPVQVLTSEAARAAGWAALGHRQRRAWRPLHRLDAAGGNAGHRLAGSLCGNAAPGRGQRRDSQLKGSCGRCRGHWCEAGVGRSKRQIQIWPPDRLRGPGGGGRRGRRGALIRAGRHQAAACDASWPPNKPPAVRPLLQTAASACSAAVYVPVLTRPCVRMLLLVAAQAPRQAPLFPWPAIECPFPPGVICTLIISPGLHPCEEAKGL